MTHDEEFAARSQLNWTPAGDAWILLYRRRRLGRVVPDRDHPLEKSEAKQTCAMNNCGTAPHHHQALEHEGYRPVGFVRVDRNV